MWVMFLKSLDCDGSREVSFVSDGLIARTIFSSDKVRGRAASRIQINIFLAKSTFSI
jgi:hypothetical protein